MLIAHLAAAITALATYPGASDASTGKTYLACRPVGENRAGLPLTWVIDFDAGRIDPVGSNYDLHFENSRFTDAKIEGSDATGSGNVYMLDLNRIDGSLTIHFIEMPSNTASGLGRNQTYRFTCSASTSTAF